MVADPGFGQEGPEFFPRFFANKARQISAGTPEPVLRPIHTKRQRHSV